MESDAVGGAGPSRSPEDKQALNSTILEYYKKFGRKRDLEQYFSLNTAQSEIKDVSSLFWRRMKSQDSSDSGEKSREASLEVCRIRIKCSTGDDDERSSQDERNRTKSDSESPPIINEDAPKALDTTERSDDDSVKSDENDDGDKSVKSEDNHSQKSVDTNLDTSINKAYSPSSSITSQRRLEWDSLADVGYANESDKKTSASSLSTLERLALKQQYSNNDTQNVMGPPTAHSTPVDEAEIKSKRKGTKTTKIYRKDVDCVEVNVPHGSDATPSQSINVNLTKHISFSVDKGGEVSVGNVKKDYSVLPEKKSVEAKGSQETVDKNIQTSLIKTQAKSSSSGEIPRSIQLYGQGVPVLINLNNLKRARRKKVNYARKKSRIRKQLAVEKENVPVLEKSGEQVSEAESFEYMPGHIYNQNQMNQEPARSNQTAGNKSSLESSGAVTTTDSSKGSKHSFTKDLENSIKLLRTALNKRFNDEELKKRLIKEVVQRLLNSTYRDDETTTDFLSGLSYSSKKLALGGNNTTTSTSDANNTTDKPKTTRPKKSILRVDKFNPSAIASTSQSAPNLPVVSNSEITVSSKLAKILTSSNSLSDASSKEKTSSDTAFAKTSSEELYLKYLDALRREEAYKKHLREKEQFLKQKLVASEAGARSSAILTAPAAQLDVKSRIKLKELMKDLTRNNYDDGSGDASKLEGGLSSDMGLRLNEGRSQRSHSVFTLSSSGTSEKSKKLNMKKSEMKDSTQAGHSKDEKHYCCCPHHYGNKIEFTDSGVQVNIRSNNTSPRSNDNVANIPCLAKAQLDSRVNLRSQGNSPRSPLSKIKGSQPVTHIVSDEKTGDIKYLCLCKTDEAEAQSPAENFMIYKCSRLSSKGVCCNVDVMPKPKLSSHNYDSDDIKPSKGSQTLIKKPETPRETVCVHEAMRVIQTDISINPRISDPSLSDIKITNNSDCVQLVGEQFRQVSKTTVENEEKIGDTDIYSQPSTSTFRAGKESTKKSTSEVEFQSDEDFHGRQAQIRAFYGDNGDYTIPIQGTNMMLKVSVGSNPITNLQVLDSNELGRPLNAIDSDEIIYARENDNLVNTSASPMTEEHSKGVQADNKALFSQYDQKPRPVNKIFSKQDIFARQSNNASSSRLKPFINEQNVAQQSNNASSSGLKPCSNDQDFARQSNNSSSSRSKPFSSEQGFARQGNNASSSRPKQFMRSNTFAGIEEGTTAARDEILEDFYDHEQWATYPKSSNPRTLNEPQMKQVFSVELDSQNDLQELAPPPVEKVDTGCGQQDRMNLGQNNDYNDKTLRSKKMCPCPVPAPCFNECPEDAACWSELGLDDNEEKVKNAACGKKQLPDDSVHRRPSTSKSPPRSPRKCPCSDSAKCDRRCGKDAVCRKQQESNDLLPRSRSPTPRKSTSSPCKSRSPSPSQCPCSDSAKCGRRCGKDAVCRKQQESNDSLPRSRPSTPPKKPASPRKSRSPSPSQCPCSDSAQCGRRCGKDAPCHARAWTESADISERSRKGNNVSDKCLNAAFQSGPPDVSPLKPTSSRKYPCSCPNSAKCGGLCKEDAPCRPKAADVKERGPAGDTGTFNSPPENSDSDQADFEKLKTFLRSRSFPQPAKRPKSFRSGSLHMDPKNHERNPDVTSSEVDESPIEEPLSAPGTSKIKGINSNDLIMNIIRDITNRYSKKGLEESQKKKCFKEILSILNYLLDTEDAIDSDAIRGLRNLVAESTSSESNDCVVPKKAPKPVKVPKTDCTLPSPPSPADCVPPQPAPTDCVPPKRVLVEKKTCDKGIQLCPCPKRPKHPNCCTESSDMPCSSEHHGTSSDSVTCKVLNKIRKECEKYHRKCCKRQTSPKRCKCSSTASMSCDQCKRIIFCQCQALSANCEQPKSVCERVKKKCVAYNLIIQTSESMISEEISRSGRPLKNIIVKVPPIKHTATNVPFKEMECEIGQRSSARSEGRTHRSKSLPNDSLSSTDDGVKGTVYSVKDYLERNRPDFIEQSGQRQKCLKMISEARASNRPAQRKLLSMQVQVEPALRALSESDLRLLAQQLGYNLRHKKEPPKLISEREMKKHSERIYKKLPEVVQKKEDLKKENIKKTNLLMASIFKKNLQKKALRGAVNLSNYSNVIKI
ncbi:hypothetical protein O0L34_g11727 [Tuta absoluta]|nr:hypothetical protein O0L34_g11727 [Tuta absoluta]